MTNKLKNIAISDLKAISKKTGCSIIVAIGYHQGASCVATYGETIDNCDEAAQAGNWIKANMLRWPDLSCVAEPHRVKKMRAEIRQLEAENNKRVNDAFDLAAQLEAEKQKTAQLEAENLRIRRMHGCTGCRHEGTPKCKDCMALGRGEYRLWEGKV